MTTQTQAKVQVKGTISFSCACVYACAYACVVPGYTLVSCAYACVVRVNQPLGPVIFIDLVVKLNRALREDSRNHGYGA